MAKVELGDITLTINQDEAEAVLFALSVVPVETFQSVRQGQLHTKGQDVYEALSSQLLFDKYDS